MGAEGLRLPGVAKLRAGGTFLQNGRNRRSIAGIWRIGCSCPCGDFMHLSWALETMPRAVAPARGEELRLIAACRRGDRDSFAALVLLHQGKVFRLAGRFFRRHEDVEDVAQETFLTVWRKLGTYRGAAPFEHWLTRVCLNCCYARMRAGRREASLRTFRGLHDGAARPDAPDAKLEIETLLASLPPADRFVLLLLDGEGWSVAEIAERLGWTRVNVKVRAHRARRRLRLLLEGGRNR